MNPAPADATPMFPLGTVLMPHMPLPLHVFEPRYRTMVDDCLAGDRTFGVTLIERGSEVGGGDLRSMVGTLATIVEAEQFADGRWGLIAVGRERIQIEQWFDDDPYPKALVEPWPDGPLTPEGEAGWTAVEAALRRSLAMKAELGEPATAATVEFSDDPSTRISQACGIAPIGPADRFALLCATSVDDRVAALGEMLHEQLELFGARLAMGDESGGSS